MRRLVGPLGAVALAAAPSGASAADGGRLLIGSCVDPPFTEAHGELFTVLPSGREPRRIRKLPRFGPDGCTDTNPMQSPDGRRIAYNRAEDIAVGPAAPRRRSRLDRIVARDGFWPSWSPESRRLAFLRRGEDGLFRVAVVGVGGGRVRDLVGPGPFELPSWTRSGRHVLYSTNVPGDPDTPRMWRIVDHPEGSMSWQLAWSPNGRRIAYVFGDALRCREGGARPEGSRQMCAPDLAEPVPPALHPLAPPEGAIHPQRPGRREHVQVQGPDRRRKLSPRGYRLVARATDGAGNTSATSRVRFRIVR